MSGQDILKNSGFTGCLSKAGLASGTAGATIDQGAPNGTGIDYAIDGIAYHRADGVSIAVTAHPQQAVSTSCLYLVQVNAAGTISTKKGVERLTADLGDNLSLQWPEPDEDNCPIGGYEITLDASTTFTNGTTDPDGAGIIDQYFDFIGGMPLAPRVAAAV
jgi:hypothetical protein